MALISLKGNKVYEMIMGMGISCHACGKTFNSEEAFMKHKHKKSRKKK